MSILPLSMTFKIINDTFPNLQKNQKEYEKYCVTYLIHNEKQIYVGETSNLRTRFKDHEKSKRDFKLLQTKIILSDFFNKSAVYDIESRLINYIYADAKFELINVKRDQSPHFYYLKDQINDQLFKNIWKELRALDIVSKSLDDLENTHLFKYSPFKEFSDNQLEVIEKIIQLVSKSTSKEKLAFDGSITNFRVINKSNGQKIIVSGGPGTGKTLLIIKLVHDLIKKYGIDSDRIAICIPQSNLLKTFKVMFKKAKIKVAIIRPVDISKVDDQNYDLLIIDEAHRLKKHFSKQTKDLKHLSGGKFNELDIVMKKSKNLVLMYDSKQTVRPADIDEFAIKTLGAIHELKLTQQFRVKKGFDYLNFIEQLLQIIPGAPSPKDLGDYEFQIIDNIHELHQKIKKKDKKFGLSRMASGYFKKWISQKDESLYDFADEGLKVKWNTTALGWVHSENAVNEVGCIHTLQGEDLNYAGVILGDEIYLDPSDNKIKINKKKYFDKNGTPVLTTDSNDKELTKYIKNIYYVLLTRGMSGTFLYVKDQNLKKYIAKCLES